MQLKQKLRQLQKVLRRYDAETADELLEKAEEAEERLNGKGGFYEIFGRMLSQEL